MKLGANRNARIQAILVMVLILFTGCSGLRTDAEVNQSVGSISERPLQNDLEDGVILAIKPTSYLIEPEEYFDERLFDITLDSGIYEISCEQDITLSYVDRNRFCFVCGDDTTYEATDNLFAGKHSWVITVLEKDRYAFNAWVVSPSEKVELSNFTIMRKGDVPIQIWRPEEDVLLENAKCNSDNTFIFFSDLHGETSNLERIIAFGESNGVNAIINSGDTVKRYLNDPEEPFSWYRESIEASGVDILSAVGNHDAWTGEYWKKNAPNDIFDQIILPVVERCSDIILPERAKEDGLCYFYKDYGRIRVIVLNAMMGDESVSFWDEAQSLWFENVLDDSIQQNKHIIIVNHAPFPKNIALRSKQSAWNSFIDYRSWEIADDIVMDLSSINMIQDFIKDGGILICLLAGHEHVDSILTAKGYNGQFMVDIASANHEKHPDGTVTNDQSSPFYDCFDFLGIDSDNGLMKIVRIGWNMDSSMKIRESLCYDYFNGEVIVQ